MSINVIAAIVACFAIAPYLCAQTMPSVQRRHSIAIPDSALHYGATLMRGTPWRTLGYAFHEMQNFNPDAYLLRSVSMLFGNVQQIPRYGATLSGNLASTTDIGALTRIAYSATDISAGRMMPVDVDTVSDVMPLPEKLPKHARQLVQRIQYTAKQAAPWLQKAFGHPLFPTVRGPKLARALFEDERMGQMATTRLDALLALQHVDRKSLAFASAIVTNGVQHAVTEYIKADSASPTKAEGVFTFESELGPIYIGGTGNNTISNTGFCTIDLGGDDFYNGVDTGSICSALFGIALLIDISGNDVYQCPANGIAAAWFGTAVLADYQGNDTYTLGGTYGLGAATVGIAVLSDNAGNDTYTCAAEGQAYAQTHGAGMLIDRSGNDVYLARLDGNPSDLYLGQTVSRAQGAAFGRRADLGDGHSLSGGVAMLLDIEGNDSYTAGAWAQGAGYWWAAGFLEDWGGNDVYLNGKYSLGAAAHFAVGSIVDVSGNDSYNVGNPNNKNQYHGHARDGSIGLAIDADGDDRYEFTTHCGGSADLCSIGILYDAQGNDSYVLQYKDSGNCADWANTPSLGTATMYAQQFSFRDNQPSLGMFLEGAGTDNYIWQTSADCLGIARVGNNTRSPVTRNATSIGLFWDK
jgi:hypothetical protein